MNVTLFTNITHKKDGIDLPLLQVLDFIKSGHWKDKVLKLRAISNEKVQNAEKLKLPNFTGSGTFSERKKECLKEHNGFIIIDFDFKALDLAVREKLIKDKYTYALFVSCRGNGFAVVVKIDKSKHLSSFLGLEEYYLSKYKLTADKSCKDVSRTRFISYDEDLYLNQDATPYKVVEKSIDKTEIILKILDKVASKAYKGNRNTTMYNVALLAGGYVAGGYIDENTVERHLYGIVNNMFNSREDNLTIEYKTVENGIQDGKNRPIQWIDKEKSDYAETRTNEVEINVQARNELIGQIHAQNRAGRYPTITDYEEYDKKNRLGVKYIEELYKKIFEMYKDEFNIDNKPDIYRVELFLKRGYELTKNEISDQLTIINKSTGETLTAESLYRELLHNYFNKFPYDKLKLLLRSNFVKTVNPIKDFFNDLIKEKSNTDTVDFITKLSDYVKLKDEAQREFFTIQFRKMLIRSIRQLFDGIPNRYIFVLIGEKQDTGKSTFIRFLSPFQRGDYYTEESLLNNKDTSIRTSENFIYNVDELANLDKASIEKVKSIISSIISKQRRAYAEFEIVRPRIANFWASTNSVDFLTDTENTRWLCFEIESIDFAYSKEVDILQVWKQAYRDYLLDYDCDLTIEEKEHNSNLNKNYVQVTNEGELLSKYFTHSNDKNDVKTVTEIQSFLQLQAGNNLKLDLAKVKKALKLAGYRSERITVDGDRQSRYFIKQRY